MNNRKGRIKQKTRTSTGKWLKYYKRKEHYLSKGGVYADWYNKNIDMQVLST